VTYVSATRNYSATVGAVMRSQVSCPSGQHAVGGGSYIYNQNLSATTGAYLTGSQPLFTDSTLPNTVTGWYGEAMAVNNGTYTIAAYALCVAN
jgi:hypothetical protein